MKFEGAESELNLLLKKNIMHGQKFSREQLMCTYNHSAIEVIKVSTYRDFKHMYFQTHTAGIIRLYLIYWREARKYQRNVHLTIQLKLGNY